MRFTSTELGELEAKIASAADRSLGLELEIFERLAASVIARERRDQAMRRGAGRASMSPARWRISPPSATTRARRSTTASPFVIEGGRHPVVEQALSRDGTPFVANDSDLSPPPAT